MTRLWMLLAAAAIGSSGCVADAGGTHDQGPAETEVKQLGGLSLSLTSSDSQGRPYRLRNAFFTVQSDYYAWGGGYDGGTPQPPTVVSTEDDPDAERLSVRLVPGQYRVSLGGDWYIERLTATGPERVEQVVLLTESSQYAYVGQDWNYDLEFRFGVDGTLIDFRHGDLNIDISIELPGEGPAGYDAGYGYDAGSPYYPEYPSYDAGIAPGPRDGGRVEVIED